MHTAQTLFPSTMCSAFVEVIRLLDDHAVSLDGVAVYEIAYQVGPIHTRQEVTLIWTRRYFCLYREIQKLVTFLVVFLGAYLCQILNMISLVSFAFLVHVLM